MSAAVPAIAKFVNLKLLFRWSLCGGGVSRRSGCIDDESGQLRQAGLQQTERLLDKREVGDCFRRFFAMT